MADLPGTKTLGFNEPLIFELSREGRFGASVCDGGVPAVDPKDVLPEALVRQKAAALPEVSEPEAVRHFVRLSTWKLSSR